MQKKLFLVVALLFSLLLSAQEVKSLYKSKKVKATADTIFIEKGSISPSFFKLQNSDGTAIDSSFYKVDFKTGKLLFKKGFVANDSITIRYFNYPEFLTKTYSIYDENRVVENGSEGNLVRFDKKNVKKFVPFEGLTTSGSITRGVTIGNNQNATVNSNLDLQISGKLSDKVSLRASIQDSNIPLQEGGYSQRLDEFDQIFIELFSDKWSVRAGDLFLENRQSRFLNFNKKVQGLFTHFNIGTSQNKTDIFAAAALVRGQYARSNFVGQEGNQGPYKLRGNNGELYVLVISGSERVFVNGILKKRGENNDYIIDYNAGEITFTSLFPINSEMRIVIEYQYSERSFTRFVTYGGATHKREKWSIGGYLYSENDVKNQPLQQSLSNEQVQVLQNAGDNIALMNAPSAFIDTYSENKVLYKKVIINGVEVFEQSNNPNDELYNVKFTFVGQNQGSYVLTNSNSIGKIYKYFGAGSNVENRNYEPIIRLIAPTKIQIATVLGTVNPNEKTNIEYEFGVSNNDQNLFSTLDDKNNRGIAGKVNFKQRLFTKKLQVDVFGNYQLIQKDFRTIERLFNIEFNRDWNLTTFSGNQSLLLNGLEFSILNKGKMVYQHENLTFSNSFSGNRHSLLGSFTFKKWSITQNASAMNSNGNFSKTTFIRNQTQARFHHKKNWIGVSHRLEDNSEKLQATQQLSNVSQRFSEIGSFIGRGDSTKVFVETGFFYRTNDSLQNGQVKRVNESHSYYIKSKLIQNNKTDLAVFVNYRNLTYENDAIPNEPSLNSRVLYNDNYFKRLLQVSSAYETNSGAIAQQEFTYLLVDQGRGVYTWNDYNNNGIQELQEFEIAPFPDQANYVRVFLPNQVFLKTHQNRFSQSITFNPLIWANEKRFRKLLSHFYNQTSFLIERKIKRDGNNFDLNPFSSAPDNLLGLNRSFRNVLFYNRGKQNHSVTYTYNNNQVKTLLNVGTQENNVVSHQLQYTHLLVKTWLFNFGTKSTNTELASENYVSKNFLVKGIQFNPKVSYLFNKNASWDLFYEYQYKSNEAITNEKLTQNRLGSSFSVASEKRLTMNGELSFFDNKFTGDALSAVGFQMLEGLQPGKNITWRLLVQKNLTQYLDININYQGRKTETSNTIHTGNVQLRAFF
jgi:hypothetical protein